MGSEGERTGRDVSSFPYKIPAVIPISSSSGRGPSGSRLRPNFSKEYLKINTPRGGFVSDASKKFFDITKFYLDRHVRSFAGRRKSNPKQTQPPSRAGGSEGGFCPEYVYCAKSLYRYRFQKHVVVDVVIILFARKARPFASVGFIFLFCFALTGLSLCRFCPLNVCARMFFRVFRLILAFV